MRWLTPASALIALAFSTLGADAADPARLFPKDTRVFVAWDGMFAKWPPVVDRVVEKYPEFVADELDEEALSALRLLESLLRRPGAVGLTRLTMEGDFAVAGLITARDNDDEKRILADLQRVLESGARDGAEAHTVTGHALHRGRIEGQWVTWGAVKGHVLVGIGENALDPVIAHIEGGAGGSLAESADYQDACKHVRPFAEGGGLVMFANAHEMVELARSGMTNVGADPEFVEGILGATGLSAFRYKIVRCSGDYSDFRCEVFVRVVGEYNGVLKLFDQKPLTKPDLELVPEDAYLAYVGNLDLRAIWDETLLAVGEIEPGALPQIEGGAEAATPFLGFSIPNDLLTALGDTWVMYNAPQTGGPLGLVLIVDARDPQKLHAAAQRVNELVDLGVTSFGARLVKKEVKHNGVTVHYMAGYRGPIPVAPAWAFKNDRMFMGLFPQSVKGALDQLDASPNASILGRPDVSDAMGRLPQPMTGFGFINGRMIREMYMGYELAIVALTQSLLGPEFADIGTYPTPMEILGENKDGVLGSARVKDGLQWSYSGTGASVAVAALPMAVGAGVVMPTMSKSRLQAQRAVSMANLRGIGMAAHLYLNDHGVFPASFQDLIDGGFITEGMLVSPVLGDDGDSYVLIEVPDHDRVKPDQAAVMIAAYEKLSDMDAIIVLFLDGHVEQLDYARFSEKLRATYEALEQEPQEPVWAGME